MDFKLEGFEELQDAMRYAVKEFGDVAEAAMEGEQKEFKKDMIRETWRAVEKGTGNLVKGFKFDEIKRGPSGDLESNFYAENKKNPHFHLVNNGHEIVTPLSKKGKKLANGGQKRGWVAGRRIKEPVVQKWRQEHEKRMEEVLEKICDEVNR